MEDLVTAAASQKKAKSLIRRFGLAVIFVAAALIPELFVVKHFFPTPFLFLFFGAVMASAWFGGMTCRAFRGCTLNPCR